jgi:5-methylcytosine-specific restriction endonuclease McrA
MLKLDQLKTNNAQNWTQINWAEARLDLAGLQYEVLKAYRSGNVIELRHLGRQRTSLLKKQKGICPVCDGILKNNFYEDLEVHHILSKKDKGSDKLSNLLLLHKTCHKQITYSKNEHLRAAWKEKGIIK